MKAEYLENKSYRQRDNAEREENAGAQALTIGKPKRRTVQKCLRRYWTGKT